MPSSQHCPGPSLTDNSSPAPGIAILQETRLGALVIRVPLTRLVLLTFSLANDVGNNVVNDLEHIAEVFDVNLVANVAVSRPRYPRLVGHGRCADDLLCIATIRIQRDVVAVGDFPALQLTLEQIGDSSERTASCLCTTVCHSVLKTGRV